MAALYTSDTIGSISTPPIKTTSPIYGANLKAFRSVINLAAVPLTASTTQAGITTSDSVLLARVPAGYVFAFGIITSGVSFSTSVLAIGTNATHASNGQYRASAVFTATDTPTLFGVTANMTKTALTADTLVYLTVGTATTPTSGTAVIDLYFTKP